MQEGGKQTAERQWPERREGNMSAKKVHFKLRMACVIDIHAFIQFRPISLSGGGGKDCYFPKCES